MQKTTKKEARQILTRLRKSGSCNQSFYEAIMENKLPQHYLARLLHYKLDFTDKLPSNIVSCNQRISVGKSKLKGSTTCIIAIRACLETMKREGIIKNPAALATADNFIQYKWNACKPIPNEEDKRTTPEEIALINRTLDTLMDYLKREYKLQ